MSSFRASLSAGKRHLIVVIALFSIGSTPNAQLLENAASEYEVSLTCTFSEDIREKKQNFRIVDELHDNALNCHWRERLFCTVKDGYTYDWKLSDIATVRKRLSQEPEPATCSCFLFDHDDILYERPCEVEVSVREFTRESSKETNLHPEDGGSRDSSTRPSEDFSLKPLHSQEDVLVIIAVTLSAAAAVLAILILMAIFVCRRYGFDYCGRKTYPTSQSNFVDPEAIQEKKPLHVQEREN